MRWVWVAFACVVVLGGGVAGATLGAAATTGTASAIDAPTANEAPTVTASDGATPRSEVTALDLGPPGRDGDDVDVQANATYAAGGDVAVRVSGQQGRVYAIYVYGSNGERVATNRTSLDADVQNVSVGSLETGSYRVVVVEAFTGAQANATFGVGGRYESGVVPELIVEEPADVATIPLSLPNGTTRATISIRDERGDYRVAATVVDRDGDGRVVLDWNTFYAGRGPVALTARGEDAVVDASRERDLNGFLPERAYELAVRANGSTLDRGTVLVRLEPLLTSRIGVYEAPAAGSPEASLDRAVETGRVETDEWLFVVVESQGLFGAVEATRDLRSVGPDQVVLTITPEGEDDGVSLVDADYVHVEEGRIVVGFAPGNDALAVDTPYDVEFLISAGHPYRGGDETTNANVRIVPAGSEPDHPVVSLESVDAPGAVDADAVANFTITLVNHGERSGTVPVSVTIGGHVVSRSVTVQGNGRAVVDLAFDTSRILEGNRTYVVKANDSQYTGHVVVGDETRDDGPTLGEYDRSGDELPGFTAVGALAALAALAVLVAARRFREST